MSHIMTLTNCKGSGKPAHLGSLARTKAVCLPKQETKGKLQQKNYTCGFAKELAMHITRLVCRKVWCVWVAEWLALPTLDHNVLGWNPAWGRIQLMTVQPFIARNLSLSSPCDLTLVRLNPDMSCLCKQCRFRSVGFFRSQLIWICTVCHSVFEFVSTTWIK